MRRRLRTAGYWLCCLLLTITLGLLLSAFHMPIGWLIAALASAGCMAVLAAGSLCRTSFCSGRTRMHRHGGRRAAKRPGKYHYRRLPRNLRGVLGSDAYPMPGLRPCLDPRRENAVAGNRVAVDVGGWASGICTMAPELRVDHRYVALSQYLRVVVVALTVPLVLQCVGAPAARSHPTGSHVTLVSSVAAIVVIVAAGYAGLKWKWPAPFLIAPMLVALMTQLPGPGQFVLALPPALNAVAYVVIGWQAGGALTLGALRQCLRLLPLTCAFIGVASAGCLVLTFVVSAWTGVSFTQAYLATTPGGIYVALAASDSAAEPLVATMQVLRLLVMNIAAIVGSKLLTTHRDSRSEGQRAEPGLPAGIRAGVGRPWRLVRAARSASPAFDDRQRRLLPACATAPPSAIAPVVDTAWSPTRVM
ncbi:membrane AbrB duplication domain protein [Mycobacterium kansasii 732]|nr:membrane AbrB duplication domain protein [Mycobacterium kansasii 732]